jgi:signal transduction histidine kinase
MKKSLHILHIEDSKEDSELTRHTLQVNGLICDFKRVDTRAEVFDALEHDSFDLILSDCTLPNFSGLHALEIAHALAPEIPFVFLSGTIGEQTAIESLRNGATDYVLKDRPSRLVPAVRRALAEAEERMLCRQLQNRMREAGRLEAVSTLSSGLAQDFDDILAAITTQTSLLAAEHENPKRVLEIKDAINHTALRAAGIVQQLMTFGHKSDRQPEPVNLNQVIHNNLESLAQRLSHQVKISFEPSGDMPAIIADVSQLERILVNVLANAVEAMPKGGEIILSTEVIASADLPNVLPDLASGDFVCLKIADTGTGMDSAIQDHIFEPFYTTKERGRGSGLGLPVVYGLMQTHGGSIHVDSEPGLGTTVSLFFSAPQTELALERTMAPEEAPSPTVSDTTVPG